MSNSRRDFFKNLMPQQKSESHHQSVETVLKLGPIGAFPVGSETVFNVVDKCLVVKSLAEGLQLVDQDTKQNYGLAIGADGQLTGDISKNWPTNSVLSIFSGEISNL